MLASRSIVTDLVLANRVNAALDAGERAALNDAVDNVRDLPNRHMLVRAGEPVTASTLLLDGFVCRYLDDRSGARQLVAIHVPGDFVDLHGYPLRTLEHDVMALGPVKVACWTHDTLDTLTQHRPHLTRMLWYATLLDAAIHREWIFRLGRLGADARVAHLLCEMHLRLKAVGLAPNDSFQLPLKQADLAEACGLTNVHVNRVLRAIRERGIMTYRRGVVEIHDAARLRSLAEFDPAYLYLQPG